jgi:hypothetical protein
VRLQSGDHIRRGGDCFGLVAFSLEQKTKSFQNVGLIVGDQGSGSGGIQS